MKLLTKEVAAKIPLLYATENTPPEKKFCAVKFFNPAGAGTWYAFEGTATLLTGEEVSVGEAIAKSLPFEDITFFGFCHIHEGEWGYFSFRELESLRLPFGLKIERDMHYHPESAAAIEARGH